MSRPIREVVVEKARGIPWWVWAITLIGGVGGTIWLLYKYFVEPGEKIINTYKEILADIYKEAKKYLEDNAKLDPPIYALTPAQEAIIAAKEKVAEDLRPLVEEIAAKRGLNMQDMIEKWGLAIVAALAAPAVITALSKLVKAWRTERPEASSNIQSAHGHTHLILNLVENEFALLGRLNVASGFQYTLQHYYSAYTEPYLNAGISYYNALIPTLPPGTMDWLIANHMLTYMTYEVSATTGIMGAMWSWWMPII